MAAQAYLGGRYRLVEQLGAGGMSIVWRGFDDVLQRQVAVKLLHPDHVANAELRRRVRREAQAAARLSHPHIAGIFDYGGASVTDGEPSPFVVMELIVGQPMSERLAGGVRMPWRDAVTVCAQVASALAQAHCQRRRAP
jgi:eukaryotic-like serine/threonine-protein kinase